MRKIKITEDQLHKLAEVEMEEGCHVDNIEDYENELDFYLSNVSFENDSYTQLLMREFNVNKDEADDIQREVRRIIKEKCKAI